MENEKKLDNNLVNTVPLKKILLVDDSLFVRTSMKKILTMEGYEIIEAENGNEALECALNIVIDLILLDLSMPKTDGFNVIETMKASSQLKHIPIIIITAHATQEHVIKCKQLGIAGFLLKPFDLVDLTKAVGKVFVKSN